MKRSDLKKKKKTFKSPRDEEILFYWAVWTLINYSFHCRDVCLSPNSIYSTVDT